MPPPTTFVLRERSPSSDSLEGICNEKGYNGFANSDGKLLTVQYLGDGKLFTYSRNDNLTEDDGKGGTKAANAIDSYSHYYSVVDLNTQTRTRMQFGGRDIDYSSGRFAQRSAFVAKENKVYFGVNTASAQPCVYTSMRSGWANRFSTT